MSAYNRFMKTELARLKDKEPNMAHSERYKVESTCCLIVLLTVHTGSRWLQVIGRTRKSRVVAFPAGA